MTPFTVKVFLKCGFTADVLVCQTRTLVYFVTLAYFCLYCEMQAQKAEIENLMSTITQLQTSLTELKQKLDSFRQTKQPHKKLLVLPKNP